MKAKVTCLSEYHIRKWMQKFKDGVQDLDDVLYPDQAQCAITPDNNAEKQCQILENHQAT
jgi:hypothetical protein